uniref:Uncharacterized protein n=1 Tax=Rhipicephalus zambeziensis TaxID=60191 RepID=A0A224YAY7_9ACAR
MHCLSWGHSHCHLRTYWLDDWLLFVYSSFIGFEMFLYISVSSLKIAVHKRLLTIIMSSSSEDKNELCHVQSMNISVCLCVISSEH